MPRFGKALALVLTISLLPRFKPFELFPVVLGILLSWLIAFLLTAGGAYTNSDPATQEACSTNHSEVLQNSPWFRYEAMVYSTQGNRRDQDNMVGGEGRRWQGLIPKVIIMEWIYDLAVAA